MAPEQWLTFGSFQLDVTDGRLWRGGQVVALRPRAVAVLRYLVEHPGRLVTKAELRQQVWGTTHITDTVLRVCVREIRAVVGDAAAAPQHFLDDTEVTTWPDGTSTGSYRFRHALYQQVLYAQLGAARRRQSHRHIGLRLEAGHGARAGEIAAQLAANFERGGEVERAVRYLQ